jgi:2-iminobutanoate/2-iminopropanoate deaminase
MMREVVATQNAPDAIGPYSQGIKAGNMVFVSGQTGIVPQTKQFAGNTVAEQTAQALKNLQAILEAAGTDMAHVVKTTVFLTDMATFSEMNSVYATFFPENPPARSTIAVRSLPLDALVEIELIAVLPD